MPSAYLFLYFSKPLLTYEFFLFIARRVFVMGPPGANRHEITLGLAEYFSWRYISCGDLIRKEIEKKSEDGKRIVACQAAFKLGT